MRVSTIHADALVLRPLSAERDAEALHAIFGSREQLRYMLREPCADVAATQALLERWAEDAKSPQWVMTDDGGEARGRITLVHTRPGVYEVGLQVAPAYQGRGYATRSIHAITEHAFADEQLKAFRVFADIDPDNVACVRAFERAEFEHEGLLRANWVLGGTTYDSVIMARVKG